MIKGNKIIGLEFSRTEQLDNDEWIEDHEQTVKLKTNYIISAFGSGLGDVKGTQIHHKLIESFFSENNEK